MAGQPMITVDGNEAAASVAYRASEVIAIYPITPASSMGELSDEWAAARRPNLWGNVPDVVEMQSEAGAAGAVHGAIQAGSLGTTFTASQGLLLMIPNMYKIAGELTPFCMHVAARALATHALSIFGDHSDVMACRQTGFAMLCSGSVQEAQDMAAIAHAATLESRVPFLHFFDGFRTSHEVAKIRPLADDELRDILSVDAIAEHRRRALTPTRPVLRGTAQNPDTFFQAREAANGYYDRCPQVVRAVMERFASRTGRSYSPYEYYGHPDADRVIVIMGSGADTVRETVDWLMKHGKRVGVLRVRLYRPFAALDFLREIPKTARAIAVLDRTKEPGAIGDPLYLDVLGAVHEARDQRIAHFAHEPRVVAGRYGLASKEFTPAMVQSVFAELGCELPRNHFTLGIVDDVTGTSLPVDPNFDIENREGVRALFYGLGSDGTVGANKNTIKIIGEETDNHVQAYFVYDSKKSGAVTVSHLRFGPQPIRSPYLIQNASFIGCHQFDFLERLDVLERADQGAVFLLNSPYSASDVWNHLPRELQKTIIEKALRFYVIDAYKVARETGMGGRINTIMQTCFFAISGVLPTDEAIARIKGSIEKAYGKRGQDVVQKNFAAVDATLAQLVRVEVPSRVTARHHRAPMVPPEAPDFVSRVSGLMLAGKGDLLPVSALPVDGTWPVGTSRWEKRNIALEIPVWEPDICTQCNQCALICPHAAIRAKAYPESELHHPPAGFKVVDYKAPDFRGFKYTLQVAPEDCTGCHLCVEVCPARDRKEPKRKAINMALQRPLREDERERYRYFLSLPEMPKTALKRLDAKSSQLLEPLFEYSGACAGCGETPYIKLLTQLFGDRLLVANATGCSSIYGGNLPTTPYTTNAQGHGPAWSNSLFEDNAEFGLGFRLAVDSEARRARALVERLRDALPPQLVSALLDESPRTEDQLAARREHIRALRRHIETMDTPDAKELLGAADHLAPKSVWIVGGDGWAYDIGFGGLDHVLATGRKVNVLVLDTEVYSNTGGQQSKATPLGAAAKFAVAGKETGKKDLGLLAMSYGHVYVARVAMGAKMNQVVQALAEAEAYPGPSLVIAYSHCIAHGYDMAYGALQQKLAVDSGVWPVYRFDPRRLAQGEAPLQLDAGPPRASVLEYMRGESRFRVVEKQDPLRFRRLAAAAEREAAARVSIYQQLSKLTVPQPTAPAAPAAAPVPDPAPRNDTVKQEA
jgi:pyruvate-ferredoxin/flavodoxin oxidoreductase